MVSCVVWTRRLFGAAIMATVASAGLADAHDQEIVLTVSGLAEERKFEMPHLNWSTVMIKKRRTENGKQAAQARGNSSEVAAG